MINGPYGTKVKVNLITLVCIINSALCVGLKEHINSHGHFMQHSKYLQSRCSSKVSKRTFPAISGPENTASYIVFDIYLFFFILNHCARTFSTRSHSEPGRRRRAENTPTTHNPTTAPSKNSTRFEDYSLYYMLAVWEIRLTVDEVGMTKKAKRARV